MDEWAARLEIVLKKKLPQGTALVWAWEASINGDRKPSLSHTFISLEAYQKPKHCNTMGLDSTSLEGYYTENCFTH